ncbi:hypothetical protein RUM43_010476 [Polyplax serrata]|uniref:Odorant receptor n=1 Tax=Polyplax serrata TaxID=468196 RepID=A0AAN8P0F8_POLSC
MKTWLNFDYFRCEPFELNFRFHVLGGFWPLETKDKRKQIVFSIFSYVCYFSCTSIVVTQCLDLFLLRDNLIKLARHLVMIAISCAVVLKGYLLLFNIDHVNQLKDEMTLYKKTRTNPRDVDILEMSNQKILTVVKTFYSLTVPCVLAWIAYPALDSSEEYITPFPIVIPWQEWTPTIYVCMYIYQSLALFSYMLNVLSVDGIFCGFVMRIIAHYDIVIEKFRSLDELESFKNENCFYGYKSFRYRTDEEVVNAVIGDNIRLHRQIIHELNIFKRIYRNLSFVHFIAITTTIATVIFDAVIFFRGFGVETLQRILYMGIMLWDTFLYCFCGSVLQEKSQELATAVYSTKWYLTRPKIRRELSFIIMKSQKAPKIYIGRFFALEMSTFVSLLKISYDITALFYKMTH